MSEKNLTEMTVIELRKLAKELHVTLRAGISKQGIIERLQEAIGSGTASADAPVQLSIVPEEAPTKEASDSAESDEEEDKPAPTETPAPGFRQSTAAPTPAPRFNARPAYQAPAYGGRSAAARPTVEPQRTQTTRPVGFTPRFGPAAQEPPAAPVSREEERPLRTEAPRPAYQPERRPAYNDASRFQPRPAADAPARPISEQRPAAEPRPAYEARPAYEQRPAHETRPVHEQRPPQSAAEMITPAECPEGSGVLELHPDGYGFLRTDSLLPTAKDIFVAASQVRRFGLRAGDRIVGRIRPMRDGDKYSAMLYLTTVNGVAADSLGNRPSFEELTPIYPRSRINLSSGTENTSDDLRLMELFTPMGFGQRGLIICPPETDKRSLMANLVNALHRNHPEAHLTTLLFNETPEEVTAFRERVDCPVLASTFDMPPEHHLRLADLAVESAARMVEMKKDVIILADSLTGLSRVFTSAALQQGRLLPGSINPASLQKAKRLFGAARCLREGGSLTVIAVMNNDPTTKLDEAIINDFRGAANMLLTLDTELAKKGVIPAIDLTHSGTKRGEAIMTPAQLDGLKLIRSVLREVPTDRAIPEILSMLDKAGSIEELLQHIRAWVAATR